MLEIFTRNPTPLTTRDIILKLKQNHLNPNKTTVYREIEFLNNLGLITGVDFGEGKKRYELTRKHHHHIICIKCKTIKDISLEKDLGLDSSKIIKTTGFKPISHSLEFFGLCKNCQ